MTTKEKKSRAVTLLEKQIGGPLTLGGTLEAIRLCDEISQVEFAKTLGMSKSYLCDLEKGRKRASAEKAKKYAEILGYSTNLFIKLSLQDQLNFMGTPCVIRLEPIKQRKTHRKVA